MKRTAQNLVEFVVVIPLLLIIIFGILEFAIYYRNVNVVEDVATEASVAASRKIVLDTMTSNVLTNANFNSAAKAASDVVTRRRGSLGLSALTFTSSTLSGTEPAALYKIKSSQTRTISGVVTPIVTLLVDYSSPNENGISVRLIYQYRTVFGGAQLPIWGSKPVVLLPKDIPIYSTKIKQYLTY